MIMKRSIPLLIAALAFSAARLTHAQAPIDPSGHWEGALDMQGNQLAFGVDFVRDASGHLTGTIEIPSQQLKGLPLLHVTLDGKSINFFARKDQTMTATIADDGAAMTGAFAVDGAAMPFSMKRAGAAHLSPEPKG